MLTPHQAQMLKNADANTRELLVPSFITTCASVPNTEEVLEFLCNEVMGPGGLNQCRNYFGQGPLHAAAPTATPEMISFLAGQNVEMNDTDLNGDTPLNIAVMFRNDAAAMKIYQLGGRLQISEEILASRLCRLVYQGDLVQIMRLIAVGANINARDNFGRTALHLANFLRRQNIIKFLLEQGADTTITDHMGGLPMLKLDEPAPATQSKPSVPFNPSRGSRIRRRPTPKPTELGGPVPQPTGSDPLMNSTSETTDMADVIYGSSSSTDGPDADTPAIFASPSHQLDPEMRVSLAQAAERRASMLPGTVKLPTFTD